jgi:hypothetical protein
VIYESGYWRDHLARQARFLREKQSQSRWTEASFARLEREVMIGFYSIRKLAEALKITAKVFEQPVELLHYTANGKTVGALNWHRLDELYHVSKGAPESKPLSFVANQMIHSFVFVPIFNEDRKLELIAFNSDRSKGRSLFAIRVSKMEELFAGVAGAYISKATYMHMTPDGNLEVVSAGP